MWTKEENKIVLDVLDRIHGMYIFLVQGWVFDIDIYPDPSKDPSKTVCDRAHSGAIIG